MKAKIDPAFIQKLAHPGAPGIIECLKRVGGDVGLRINEVNVVFSGPANAILKRQAPAKIDTDPLFQ